MTNTEMLIKAMTSGIGGGEAEGVSFNTTFSELNKVSQGGKRVIFGDEITINTPLVPEGYVNLYMEIGGMNYIDFTPLGGDEQYVFNTVYDATDNPAFGKLMSLTVTCHDNDLWTTQVTYINPVID